MDDTPDKLSPDELESQNAELLPDREAMSLIGTNPQGYKELLGGTPSTGTAAPTADQAPGVASDAATPAAHTASDAAAAHPPAGPYSPDTSASAKS